MSNSHHSRPTRPDVAITASDLLSKGMKMALSKAARIAAFGFMENIQDKARALREKPSRKPKLAKKMHLARGTSRIYPVSRAKISPRAELFCQLARAKRSAVRVKRYLISHGGTATPPAHIIEKMDFIHHMKDELS